MILRLITEADLPLILAWRSNPLCYQGFVTQKSPLVWEEHLSWWRGRNQDWRTFLVLVIEDDVERPVGLVNIGQLDHWSPELGYTIGEVSLWGKGIGKEAVRLGMEWLKSHGKQYCHTTIRDDNKRSIRLIKSLGFTKLGRAREGESWWHKKIL